MDSRVKLKEAEMTNLSYKWKVATIVYKDGTKERYSDFSVVLFRSDCMLVPEGAPHENA